jgi:hypothetical protein
METLRRLFVAVGSVGVLVATSARAPADTLSGPCDGLSEPGWIGLGVASIRAPDLRPLSVGRKIADWTEGRR